MSMSINQKEEPFEDSESFNKGKSQKMAKLVSKQISLNNSIKKMKQSGARQPSRITEILSNEDNSEKTEKN